jgi:hypothetical protein
MEIINTIKNWSIQKKVFVSLAGVTIIIGTTYGIIKVNDYIVSRKYKNKNKKIK